MSELLEKAKQVFRGLYGNTHANADALLAANSALVAAALAELGVQPEPYVDVTITPSQLVNLPYYDPGRIGEGRVIVPAPTDTNLWIRPTKIVTFTTPGNVWATDSNVILGWDSANARVRVGPILTAAGALTISDYLPDPGAGPFVYVVDVIIGNTGATILPTGFALPTLGGKQLVIWSETDVTGGGVTTGTRSLILRVYYKLEVLNPVG